MGLDVIYLRQGVAADFESVLSLYRELDRTHQLLDVSLSTRRDKDRREQLRRALKDPSTRVVVARSRNDVVGFAIATITRSRDVVIQAVAVDREFRRRGIGASLIRDVESWAQEKSARYVELDVYEFNPEARSFYEALGYLTVRRVMRRDPTFEIILPKLPR